MDNAGPRYALARGRGASASRHEQIQVSMSIPTTTTTTTTTYRSLFMTQLLFAVYISACALRCAAISSAELARSALRVPRHADGHAGDRLNHRRLIVLSFIPMLRVATVAADCSARGAHTRRTLHHACVGIACCA